MASPLLQIFRLHWPFSEMPDFQGQNCSLNLERVPKQTKQIRVYRPSHLTVNVVREEAGNKEMLWIEKSNVCFNDYCGEDN